MGSSNATNLELKDFAPYALPTPRWYLPAGILLEIGGWAIFLTGVFVGRIIGMVVLAISLFTVSIARRLQINTRKRLLAADRQPILYVRSFPHERSAASMTAADSAIAIALKDIGPLVAVGVPQEKLPPSGALRLYFRDEEWQEKVEALMSMSRLIIIEAGYTVGLDWEMKTARQYFSPEEIYISFLGWEKLDEDKRFSEFLCFKGQLERAYGISLPGSFFHNSYFIYFNRDWSPAAATISWPRKFFLFPKLVDVVSLEGMSPPAIREILRPVFQKRRMKLSLWRTILRVVVARLLFVVFLFYFFFITLSLKE